MSSPASLSAIADDPRRRLDIWMAQNPEAVAKIWLWVDEQMAKPEDAGSFAEVAKSFMEGLVPRNWWSLGIGTHQRASRLMAESGICLVWVPPPDVIKAIIRASDKEERDEVLVDHAEAILVAIDQVLTEVTHPRLSTTTAAAREAVAAHRAGFLKAAQSHAAAILGDVVERHLGFERFSNARCAFEREPADDAGLWSFRRVAVQAAIHAAISRSDELPPDAGFNRHLSVHGIDVRQFTPAHALAALMLVGGALRELHEIYRVAERGFGPSPRLRECATMELERRAAITGGGGLN